MVEINDILGPIRDRIDLDKLPELVMKEAENGSNVIYALSACDCSSKLKEALKYFAKEIEERYGTGFSLTVYSNLCRELYACLSW